MNYIYDIFLKADEQNVDREKIRFKQAKVCSPYMEIAFDEINFTDIPRDKQIEINSFYRFQEIFQELFDSNFEENIELRNTLFDILIHYLGEMDLKSGLSKNEFYKMFLLKDIRKYVFGKDLNTNIDFFNKEEKDIFLNSLITLYKTGTSLELFNKVLVKIFKYSTIYLSKDAPKDIYIYLSEYKNETFEGKINAIVDTFLPVNMNSFLFWDKHFGIIGEENVMKSDEIVMVE